MTSDTPDLALAAAAALHLGFQVVVTAVVYPAFRGVRPEDWPAHEAAHARRIGPVVAVVYSLLAGACIWVLVSGPEGLASWVALAGAAAAALATGLVAAPAHRRLGAERDPGVLRRLLLADRVRLAAATVTALGAWWAVLG